MREHQAMYIAPSEQVFAAARETVERKGLELFLPANQALAQRHCPFITDEAVFITANGDVMLYRYLWHIYSCRLLGEDIRVLEL